MTCLSLSNPEVFHRVYFSPKQSGFSLIEMAIVLVILGFILGGVVTGLSSQREIQKNKNIQNQLEEIRNAVIGYVQINGRLPCPASLTSKGGSVSTPAGVCTGGNSMVPYADLGIRGALSEGPDPVLIDSWLQPIRYRVTSVLAGSWFYTSIPGTIGLTANPPPDFSICRTVPCPPAPSPNILATNIVAVFFSTGDPLIPSVNITATTEFRSDAPSSTFDDTVIWLSQPELVYALSKAR
jgi:prepilin-type N-terminal cleavage/methylation domain-containing protein